MGTDLMNQISKTIVLCFVGLVFFVLGALEGHKGHERVKKADRQRRELEKKLKEVD